MSARKSTKASPGARQKAVRSLLLVDDETNILKALVRSLRSEGLEIRTAQSGTEALARMTEAPADIVLSDNQMPDMKGLELFRVMRERWPDAMRVLLTANGDTQAVHQAVRTGDVNQLFWKPWNLEELRRALHLFDEAPQEPP